MKKVAVVGLERVCSLLDMLVLILPEKVQLRWYCRLAELSARLDEKWQTGVWK